MSDSWSALLQQAFGLLTQETSDSQFLTIIGALILLALVLEGISSLFFRRRWDKTWQNETWRDERAERHASRDVSSAFKWQPASLPRAAKTARKKRVRTVRPARLFRPNIKRTGTSGALAQIESMTMPMVEDMRAEDMRAENVSAEDTSAPANSYDLPHLLEPPPDSLHQPMTRH